MLPNLIILISYRSLGIAKMNNTNFLSLRWSFGKKRKRKRIIRCNAPKRYFALPDRAMHKEKMVLSERAMHKENKFLPERAMQ